MRAGCIILRRSRSGSLTPTRAPTDEVLRAAWRWKHERSDEHGNASCAIDPAQTLLFLRDDGRASIAFRRSLAHGIHEDRGERHVELLQACDEAFGFEYGKIGSPGDRDERRALRIVQERDEPAKALREIREVAREI